jgi:threonine dehydratase
VISEADVRIDLPTLKEVKELAAKLLGEGLTSRILQINASLAEVDSERRSIFLKMESELPFGSYKMRGVRAAVLKRIDSNLPFERFMTISAGNMAQAVAAVARDLGKPVTAIVPDSAPKIKLEAIASLGAKIIRQPISEVWDLVENPTDKTDELLIHPLATPGILAGYGTIALELIEQVPDCDAVFIPFGVGGLILGIAAILQIIAPHIKIIAVETAAAPTFTLALKNGEPTLVQKGKTCADAIGTPRVVPAALNLLMELVDDTVVVTETEIRSAIKNLYQKAQIVVEGAAAAGVAAAVNSKFKKPVVIVTGKNINPETFNEIINNSSK